jgi:CRISPR-associated protein Csd1
MLLRRLVELADRDDLRAKLPPPFYTDRVVRWRFLLDADGSPRGAGLVDLADAGEKGAERGRKLRVPTLGRTSAPLPLLLADDAEYTFGVPGEAGKDKRAATRHALYRQLLAQPDTPETKAVLRFIDGARSTLHDRFPQLRAKDAVVFSVDGTDVHDLPAVRRVWQRYCGDYKAKSGSAGTCLVCGQEGALLDRLPLLVKRIPGGQTAGVALSSANEAAHHSYGLREGGNAPVCIRCGERAVQALNHLLRDESCHVRLPDAQFVFWTRAPSPWQWGALLTSANAEDVATFLQRHRTGGPAARIRGDQFYGLTLSASGGRLLVRDWIETSVADIADRLARWHRDVSVRKGWFHGTWSLARTTVRPAKAAKPAPGTERRLVESALFDRPLDLSLVARAVRRVQAEHEIPDVRAALIKVALTRNRAAAKILQEVDMTTLDAIDHPAFTCGRLLTELAELQRAALGPSLKTTIVDRYYGAASSRPHVTFPQLLKLSKAHLKILRRDKPGLAGSIDRRIEDLMTSLAPTGFPGLLALPEQGLFALGVYYQQAQDRAVRQRHADRTPGRPATEASDAATDHVSARDPGQAAQPA